MIYISIYVLLKVHTCTTCRTIASSIHGCSCIRQEDVLVAAHGYIHVDAHVDVHIDAYVHEGVHEYAHGMITNACVVHLKCISRD